MSGAKGHTTNVTPNTGSDGTAIPIPGPGPKPPEKKSQDHGWKTIAGGGVVILAGVGGFLLEKLDFFQALFVIGFGLSVIGVRGMGTKFIREIRSLGTK
jgi:hypothetical protein